MAQAIPLRYADLHACVEACPPTRTGVRDRALIITMYELTLRGCEAAALRWRHHTGDTVEVQPAKRSRGRTLRISPDAADMLDEWHSTTRRPDPDDRIFGLAASSIRYRLRVIGDRGGIARLSGHSCRRGGAHDMRSNGMSLLQIQQRLGHAQIATTERYLGAEMIDGGAVPDAIAYHRDGSLPDTDPATTRILDMLTQIHHRLGDGS